jgi:hypothetical protein
MKYALIAGGRGANPSPSARLTFTVQDLGMARAVLRLSV